MMNGSRSPWSPSCDTSDGRPPARPTQSSALLPVEIEKRSCSPSAVPSPVKWPRKYRSGSSARGLAFTRAANVLVSVAAPLVSVAVNVTAASGRP